MIRYDLPSSEVVTLRVFDASGRTVRVLRDSVHEPPGGREVVWDGRDDSGRRLLSDEEDGAGQMIWNSQLRAGSVELGCLPSTSGASRRQTRSTATHDQLDVQRLLPTEHPLSDGSGVSLPTCVSSVGSGQPGCERWERATRLMHASSNNVHRGTPALEQVARFGELPTGPVPTSQH